MIFFQKKWYQEIYVTLSLYLIRTFYFKAIFISLLFYDYASFCSINNPLRSIDIHIQVVFAVLSIFHQSLHIYIHIINVIIGLTISDIALQSWCADFASQLPLYPVLIVISCLQGYHYLIG